MRWIDKEREMFVNRFIEYWPQKENSGSLLSLFVQELEAFPVSVALGALRRVKVEQDFNRTPGVKRVLEAAREIHKHSPEGKAKEPEAPKITEEQADALIQEYLAAGELFKANFAARVLYPRHFRKKYGKPVPRMPKTTQLEEIILADDNVKAVAAKNRARLMRLRDEPPLPEDEEEGLAEPEFELEEEPFE